MQRESYSNDSVFVFSLNLKGMVRNALPAFQDLMGQDEEALRKRHVHDFMVEIPAAVKREIETALENELPWRGILRFNTKPWGKVWLDVFARPTYRRGKRNGSQWLITQSAPELAERAAQLYRRKNPNKITPWQGITAAITSRLEYGTEDLASTMNSTRQRSEKILDKTQFSVDSVTQIAAAM